VCSFALATGARARRREIAAGLNFLSFCIESSARQASTWSGRFGRPHRGRMNSLKGGFRHGSGKIF